MRFGFYDFGGEGRSKLGEKLHIVLNNRLQARIYTIPKTIASEVFPYQPYVNLKATHQKLDYE